GVVDRALDHLAQDGLAEALLQHRHRYLAGAEAGECHGAAELLQAGVHLGFDIGRSDDDLEFALQAFGADFGNLHGRTMISRMGKRWAFCRIGRPLIRGSRAGVSDGAAGHLVRAEGLEPTRLSSPEPKSGVSTSSTTPAPERGRAG